MSGRVRVAVLAAGQATRFGRQKLLETWQGKPLLSHSLAVAQDVLPGCVDVVHDRDLDIVRIAEEHDRPNLFTFFTSVHFPREFEVLILFLYNKVSRRL